MNLKTAMEKFDYRKYHDSLLSDPMALGTFISAFSNRNYTISDIKDRAGEAMDRKLLYSWKERGLLPFDKESGWGKFNFVELVWLRLVMELREIGLGLERILVLKEYYFNDDNYLKELYQHFLSNSAANLAHLINTVSEGGKELSFETFSRTINRETSNRLSHHIIGIVLNRDNICLCINLDGKIELYELGRMLKEARNSEIERFPAWYEVLSSRSNITVNLTSIIAEISQTHELFEIKEDQLIIRQSAEAIIKRLFTDKQIVEVTIRMTNREEPLVYIKRKLTFKELNQKINDLQRKGVFRDMTIKSRDGKVQSFESVDIIKL